MRVLVGGLIAGLILYAVPGQRSGPACLIAGALTAWLMRQAEPRAIIEKVALALALALVAWTAGPRAAHRQSLAFHLLGWLIAGTALAFYLHPKPE